MSTKKENMRDYYNQTEYSVIDKMIKNNNANQRNIMFCVVTEVNGNRINAKPLVAESINQPDGEKFISLPMLKNIPFVKTGHVPSVGDFCICFVLDRPISGIKKEDYENVDFTDEKNIPIINSNGRVRDLNSCVALVGVEL